MLSEHLIYRVKFSLLTTAGDI